MVKVDIISGFLGSGKTTLIKKLLSEALADTKVVLIENEFGEIGIDGGFLEEAGVQIREMNSGCICCSLSGDFKTALQEVLHTYAPERVIIEPSGVGKLSDVVAAVEGVEADLQISSKSVVVDVNKCKMYLKNFGEFFLNQVEHADTILLSRTGNVSSEKVQQAVDLLRTHNAHATMVTTPWDMLDGKALLAELEEQHNLEAETLHEVQHAHEHHHEHGEACTCGHHHGEEHHHAHEHHHHEHGEACTCGHHHGEEHHHAHEHHHHEHGEACTCGHHHEEGHHHAHEHHHHEHGEACTCGHHHADEVFVSWGMETPAVYSAEKIQSILAELDKDDVYGTVLRAKGMVDGGNGTWVYFDYVPGEAQVRTGAAMVTGKLCVIGAGLNQDALTRLFA
ncbi:MAG: GTP-binding protein [Peptococcaceae bacterium]|nr:GTP-binding protein [Peptococcaceae bacterium]